jgi:hypothetical protein
MTTTETTFSRRTDLVWAVGMASALAATAVASFAFPYPEHATGQFWIYATVLSRVLLYAAAGGTRAGRVYRDLLAMGLVAGFVELLADYFLVHWIDAGRLVYITGNDIVLLASPIYMPLAWACVVVEFGYLILRLSTWIKPWAAVLAGAVDAGVTIGFYEIFAYKAGWWRYEPARAMIGAHCALYIPLAEFLMFLPFSHLYRRFAAIEDPQARAVLRGGLFGLGIFAAYALAYAVLERP